jgi:hypothetical protein
VIQIAVRALGLGALIGVTAAYVNVDATPRPIARIDFADSVASGLRPGIAVVATSGALGLERRTVLDSTTARYVTVTRRACDTGKCAPIDSSMGTVSASDVERLFNIVESERVFSLDDDYGVCNGCDDRAEITTAVYANGRRKVIRSSRDVTLELLGRVHLALAEAIRAAREE